MNRQSIRQMRLEDIPLYYSLEELFDYGWRYSRNSLPRIFLKYLNLDYHALLFGMADPATIDIDDLTTSNVSFDDWLFAPQPEEKLVTAIKGKMQEHQAKNGIIFCRTIEQAQKLQQLLPNSSVVHDELTIKECQKILNSFREGQISFLITADAANEGIDFPRADALILLRVAPSFMDYIHEIGKALRPYRKKHEVTVIDFITGVEHMQIIAWIEKELQFQHTILHRTFSNFNLKVEFPSNVDSSIYQHCASGVYSKLKFETKRYYTKQLFIHVQEVATKLKRKPTEDELDQSLLDTNLKRPSELNLTWAEIFKKIDLFPEANSDDLIREVQALANKLGRTPTITEYRKQTSSYDIMMSRYGKWTNFLAAANLPKITVTDLSDEDFFAMARRLAKELNRPPRAKDFQDDKFTVGYQAILQRFGSWPNFLQAAGLD